MRIFTVAVLALMYPALTPAHRAAHWVLTTPQAPQEGPGPGEHGKVWEANCEGTPFCPSFFNTSLSLQQKFQV